MNETQLYSPFPITDWTIYLLFFQKVKHILFLSPELLSLMELLNSGKLFAWRTFTVSCSSKERTLGVQSNWKHERRMHALPHYPFPIPPYLYYIITDSSLSFLFFITDSSFHRQTALLQTALSPAALPPLTLSHLSFPLSSVTLTLQSGKIEQSVKTEPHQTFSLLSQ